jgi:hypothetical protein
VNGVKDMTDSGGMASLPVNNTCFTPQICWEAPTVVLLASDITLVYRPRVRDRLIVADLV